jgi:hypothetical protein
LGGEAFARPAGIEMVEIDPTTGLLATPFCPQRERMAMSAALAPHMECYAHTQAGALLAENAYADEAEQDSAILILPDGTRRSVSAQTVSTQRALPPPRVLTEIETFAPQPAHLRSTHVETNAHGRQTLVTGLP